MEWFKYGVGLNIEWSKYRVVLIWGGLNIEWSKYEVV